MRRLFLAATIAFAPLAVDAAPVTVVNAGFEAPALEEGVSTIAAPLGWTLIGIGGAFNPLPFMFAGGTPEGANTGYMNNGRLLQQIGTIDAGTSYTLSAQIGNRFGLPFPAAEFGFFIGNPAGTNFVTALTDPGDSLFSLQSTSVMASELSPFVGSPLLIGFGSDGIQLNIDAVTVEAMAAVPLPAGGLLLVGALGLLAALRQRQHTLS